ncbi:MAG: serine protease [Verrucomicrobiaceae bacterium]
MKPAALFLSIVFMTGVDLSAQAPDVPVVRDDAGLAPQLIEAAKKLRDAGKLLEMGKVNEQLSRTACELNVPAAATKPLAGGEIWSRARKAHIRVGYLFLCSKCEHLHLNLSGGYAITADGVVATCYHVMQVPNMKEGHLVAATDGDVLIPVTEVLAGSKATDVCIVRVQSDRPLEPLPLNANVRPGDDAWCYSDPFGRSSYFSKGIVNRFFQHANNGAPVRMNVSTDWAPGSSGSAVLDSSGNAIGHVSEISAQGSRSAAGPASAEAKHGETYIVFHDAVRAADVQALIKPKH